MNLGEQMFENKYTRAGDNNSYDDITLGNKGIYNDSYQVKEFMTTKQNKSTNLIHEFGDNTHEPDIDVVSELNRKIQGIENEAADVFDDIEELRSSLRAHEREPDPDMESIKLLLKDIENNKKFHDGLMKDLEQAEIDLHNEHMGINPYEQSSQLGWNRVHQDEINGKPTTVLNELQSDWMQAEREGAGTFESRSDEIKKKLKEIKDISTKLDNLEFEYMKQNPNSSLSALRNSKEYTKLNDKLIELDPEGNLTHGNQKIIADFPMKPEKFQQLMIVDAINESIENGTNRVVIPIQRENEELAGTAGVTKVYERLSKQLKTIQKKLSASNLEIKLSREDYSTLSIKDDDGRDIAIDYLESAMTVDEYDSLYLDIVRKMDGFDYDNTVEVDKWYKAAENYVKNSESANKNELHVIEVVKKPKTKVNWDVYGLIAALGLTDTAIELSKEEN